MEENLTPSLEDYVEIIYGLSAERGFARVKEIAASARVSSASVTQMLPRLVEHGLASHEQYGYIQLTAEGRRVAEKITRRHQIITRFLSEMLGIDEAQAEADACKFEHSISEPTLSRLVDFIQFVESRPKGSRRWLENFYDFVEMKE